MIRPAQTWRQLWTLNPDLYLEEVRLKCDRCGADITDYIREGDSMPYCPWCDAVFRGAIA